MSDFDKCRIMAYWDSGLSYHSIAASIGRDSMTVCRMWNGWIQEGHTKRNARFQQSAITNTREERHLIHMVLIDRIDTSLDLSQEMGSFSRQ